MTSYEQTGLTAELQLAMQVAYGDFLRQTNQRASDKVAAEFAQAASLGQSEGFAGCRPIEIFMTIAGSRIPPN